MLYEQKPAEQTCPKSHPPCLLVFHLDALAGSGVTEEKETIATSGPDEAVRAGGVMEHLIHGTGPFPGGCCGLLHTHQSADISDPTKSDRQTQ